MLRPSIRGSVRSVIRSALGAGVGGIAALNSQGLLDLWLDFSDLSTLWLASDETGGNITADGQTVGKSDDKTTNGYDFTQSNSSLEPTYDLTGSVSSIEFNGTRYFGAASVSLPSSCSVFLTVKTTDTVGILFTNTPGVTSYQLGTFNDGGSGFSPSNLAGSPTIHVDDGAALANNQDAFHDAIADGAYHTIEFRTANLSAWSGLYLSAYTANSFGLVGNVGKGIVVIDSANLTEPRRQTILSELRNGVGL